jgi:hypothetical protein
VTGQRHQPGCVGFHAGEVSCEQAIEKRARWDADVWHCRGRSRSGYHCFEDGDPVCVHQGCDQRRSILMRPHCSLCKSGLECVQDGEGYWFFLCPACDLDGWLLRR